MSRLTDLLTRFSITGRRVSKASIFDLARQERFTGYIGFHFRDGIAHRVESGRTVQVDLDPDEPCNPLTKDGQVAHSQRHVSHS